MDLTASENQITIGSKIGFLRKNTFEWCYIKHINTDTFTIESKPTKYGVNTFDMKICDVLKFVKEGTIKIICNKKLY